MRQKKENEKGREENVGSENEGERCLFACLLSYVLTASNVTSGRDGGSGRSRGKRRIMRRRKAGIFWCLTF